MVTYKIIPILNKFIIVELFTPYKVGDMVYFNNGDKDKPLHMIYEVETLENFKGIDVSVVKAFSEKFGELNESLSNFYHELPTIKNTDVEIRDIFTKHQLQLQETTVLLLQKYENNTFSPHIIDNKIEILEILK